MQRRVGLVISETAVNVISVGKYFLEKNGSILLNASEYQKICKRLRSVNCDLYVFTIKQCVNCDVLN